MADRIYIRGFPSDFTDADLKKFFRQYGRIKKAYIVKETEGTPKLYGIVRYLNPGNTKVAIEGAHMKLLENINWYVAMCDKKAERSSNQKRYKSELVCKTKGRNLFISGFPEKWTVENIKEWLGKYGTIESAKVIGNTAFVLFGTIEAAKNAFEGEKKVAIEGKLVYITFWKNKELLAKKIMYSKAQRVKRDLNQDTPPGEKTAVEEINNLGESALKSENLEHNPNDPVEDHKEN